ncbi:MAG: hypothetical protein JNL12_02150 [Planctomycetes bacterium]|nr:hypothetical protein [Planctomycetota bacterium]
MTPSEQIPDEIDTPRPKAAVQFPVIPWALGPLQITVARITSSRIPAGLAFEDGFMLGALFLVSFAWSVAWMVQALRCRQPSVLLLLMVAFWGNEVLQFAGMASSGVWPVSLATATALSAWFVVLLLGKVLGALRRLCS